MQMNLTFREETAFQKVRAKLMDGDDDFREFQNALMETPRAGPVIPGSGGARKIRWADDNRGKGKRGGIRIYILLQ